MLVQSTHHGHSKNHTKRKANCYSSRLTSTYNLMGITMDGWMDFCIEMNGPDKKIKIISTMVTIDTYIDRQIQDNYYSSKKDTQRRNKKS